MMRYCLMLFLAICLSTAAGCGIIAMTAVDTARGGISEILTIHPIENLQSYESLEISPFTSNLGGLINEELLSEINHEIASELSGIVNKSSHSKRLHVSGAVIHITDGTYEKQIVVRVRLRDATDDQTLGLANISAHANSIRGMSEGVDALAEGLVDLLAQNQFPGLIGSSSY